MSGARLSRRSGMLAAGALVLLVSLFIVGRPWALSEHDRYRTELRQLRVASAELEQDVLRSRLALPELHGSSPAEFAALRARAEQLRAFPSFLTAEDRRTLNVALDNFERALAENETLLARSRAGYVRFTDQREVFPKVAFAAAAALPAGPSPLREKVEGVTASVLVATRPAGAGFIARVETALAALQPEHVRAPASVRPAVDALEAAARELVTLRRESDVSLQALLDHSASAEVERLISTYLQLYERTQARAERSRIAFFGVSLLLGAYVLVVLVRLTRTSSALESLNSELERRVEERTGALSAANGDLRASEARKTAILEASPDGILLLDEGGRVLELNPSAERTLRLSSADAAGRDFLTLALPASLPMAQRENVIAALRASAGRATRLESACLRADGGVFPSELTIARVPGDGPPRFTAFVRDITERKEVERMKNEFISTVSHELRTPLTSIRGSLGLLEGGIMGELPAQALDMVRIARTNTERLIRLINDILDLEKMEAGKLELKLAPLECSDLVDATLAGIQGMADAAGVTLRGQVEDAPQVKGDRDRLIQVLTNLVSNAVKFSPSGGVVMLSALYEPGGRVRFSVKDQGPGIPPEQRARLFGRFQQLDGSDTRSKGGTGLGLAISQAIVDQHGGRIEVESEPGQGSTFTFSLEAARPAATEASGVSVPRDESRHNVLVATADTELSTLLRGLLSAEGYRVMRAANLADAAEALEEAVPDALVVDTQMPDGQALDWVRRLREQPRTRDLPVLALSGRSAEAEGVGTPLLVDWMVKPLEETRLLKALRYAMRQPGQARVLVVDDDASTRRTLCAQLERLGVQVFEAADGESAVVLARETPPDLIVLDVGLPRLDGFEVVDILRQGKGRTTPLIVFTGRDLSRMDERQLTLGITRHLTKARSSEDELVSSVRELLNGLLARREASAPEARKALP